MAHELIIKLYGNLGEYLSFSLSSFLKQIFYQKTDEPIVYAGWHQLPDDLMEAILRRLNLIDGVRLGSVCRSWRAVVKQEHIRTAPSLWLLLPHCPDSKSLNFFSTSEGIVRTIKLPRPARGGWCFGSSRGWLTFARWEKGNPQVFIFNPLSGFRHHLPSLTKIPSFDDYVGGAQDPSRLTSFIRKIELSSTDLSKCIVAATFREPADVLALCKPGDKEWSVFQGLKGQSPRYLDIIFHEDKLYALMHKGAFFASYSIELAEKREVIFRVIQNIVVPLIHTWWRRTLESHFVESDGELLIVKSQKYAFNKRRRFQVFKIGFGYIFSSIRPRFTRLTSMGDKKLFLSKSKSLSISGPDFNGIGGNRICFADYINDYCLEDDDPTVSRQTREVFYLDDERPMCWFSPHP